MDFMGSVHKSISTKSSMVKSSYTLDSKNGEE